MKRSEREFKLKDRILAFGTSAIFRLGSESPAGLITTDTYVLKYICDLVRGEKDSILVCGGWDSFSLMKKVERYSISTETWMGCPDIPKPRFGHGIGLADDGRIFVIGGIVNWEITNSVIALDTADLEKG